MVETSYTELFWSLMTRIVTVHATGEKDSKHFFILATLLLVCILSFLWPTDILRHTPCSNVLTSKHLGSTNSQLHSSYLAICAIVKDQSEDLLEWALYHMMLGAEIIYLFDHNSTVPMINELLPVVKSGNVVYNFFKRIPESSNLNPQLWAYQECINRYWNLHKFIAFIDADEFIVLNRGEGDQNLPRFLKQFEQYGALGVNWRIMGSDNHTTRPQGGILKNYISCFPETELVIQRHIKSIVNTNFNATIATDPHYFDIAGGNTVDVFGNIINGPFNEAFRLQGIALHHYLFKSKEDFYNKNQRGAGDGTKKPMEFFDLSDQATDACRWGRKLAKNLEIFTNRTFPDLLNEG